MMRKLLLLFLLTSISVLGFSQVSFYTNVNKTQVGVGEVFNLSFILENANERNFKLPNLNNFEIVAGPMQSSSFQSVNGRSTSSFTVLYQIRALKTGKLVIPSAEVKVQGKIYKTNPVTINVSKNPNYNPSSSGGGASKKNINKTGNLIADIDVSRTSVIEGEPIVVKYIVYSRYSNLNFAKLDAPIMDGFWVNEIVKKQLNWESYRKTINGQQYAVAIPKEYVVIPQKTGKLTIPAFNANIVVQGGFFEPSRQIAIASDPVTIHVKALPNKGSDFCGGVGHFELKSKISTTKLKTNDPITLKLTLSGSGNIKLINAPKPELNNEFESFDPKISDNIQTNRNGMSGSRTFEYVLIPRFPGDFTIPPIKFKYYDINAKAYKTLASPSYKITVQDDGSGTASSPSYISKENVKLLGEDIRFIKKETTFQKENIAFSKTIWFPILSILPFLCFVFVFFYEKKKSNVNVNDVKMRKAAGVALKKIKKAENLLNKGEQTKFFGIIQEAIFAYFADRLKINLADLSLDVVMEKLSQRKVDTEITEEIKKIIQTCQMAEYAPISSTATKEISQRASQLIKKVDKWKV